MKTNTQASKKIPLKTYDYGKRLKAYDLKLVTPFTR